MLVVASREDVIRVLIGQNTLFHEDGRGMKFIMEIG